MGNAPEIQISVPCKPTDRGQSDMILTTKAGEMGASDGSGVVMEGGGCQKRWIRSGRKGEVDEVAGGSRSGRIDEPSSVLTVAAAPGHDRDVTRRNGSEAVVL